MRTARVVKRSNQWATDAVPMLPSLLARQEADDLYPYVSTSALRMLAERILKGAHMSLPLSNRAACVAVVRGIRGHRKAVRRGAR